MVAHDCSRALYTWARVATSVSGQSGRVRFPGLDPRARCVVRLRSEFGETSRHENIDPAWFTTACAERRMELPGAVLATAGVPLPTLNPQQAMVFDVVRAS